MKILKTLNHSQADQGGFTLIELLVVIGILAILLSITLIAINPNKHFQDTRNTQRASNVSEILNAIYEYESANNGNEPPSVANVTSTPVPLAAEPTQSASTTTFSSPHLTFVVPSGNLVTTGEVTVTGCTDAGNNGTFPVTGGSGTLITVTDLGGVATDGTCSVGSFTGVVNLCPDVVPTYIAALPMDPSSSLGTQCASSYDSGYTISAASGRFTIAAPSAEDSATISVTR